MPLTNQYFITGIDFTTLGQVSSGSLNSAVNGATTAADKGIVLVTTDTAVNVPDIPDTATYPEFKKHLWLRLPFNNTYKPLLYCWNNAINDWSLLIVDVFTIEALAQEANDNATAALNTANATNSNLSAVTNVANSANLSATQAVTTANNALSLANGAQATSTSANNNANTALGLGLKLFTSTTLHLTNNNLDILEENHGLTGVPVIVRPVLINLTADLGYVPNDELDIRNALKEGNVFNLIYSWADATKVYCRVGVTLDGVSPSRMLIMDRATGTNLAATRASWGIKVYAFARA